MIMTLTPKFYLVGGAVRDKFLGIASKDKDYAVEAPSFAAMREAIIARGGKIFLETPKYFTIRAHVPELGATDYTLCRKDGEYVDGRHPENVTIGTIQDDLARRDFTMNAIAIDTDNGDILDPFKGMNDIVAKMIACVGNPIDRFREDKLRVFRAARFSLTKNFKFDWETAQAMNEVNDFSGVSTERIRDELLKMFQAETLGAYMLLYDTFPNLGRVVNERGIWFKPTTEVK